MKVNTGITQGSKLSPSLFSFYIADILRPAQPVKRVCYADDLTIWATGIKSKQLSRGDNCVPERLLPIDICLKVISNILHPRHAPSQGLPENTHRGLTAITGPMPKDLRSPPGHLIIIQQAYQPHIRDSIQQKQ